MAKHFKPQAAARIAGSSIDLPLAAFAAIAVAFAVFAMPVELMSRLIAETRLPSLLAAAEPPLGMTARIALMVAGAAATFLGTWFLLRTLGRSGAPAAPAVEETEPRVGLRLRRADAHPDAPPRPPLFAGRDLGEPEGHAEEAEFEPFAEEAEAEPDLAEPEEDTLVAVQPEEETLLAAEPEEPAEDLPELVLEAPEPVSEPTAAEREEASAPVQEEPSFRPRIRRNADEESVTALMQRLEGGLLKRKGEQVPAPPALEAQPAEPEPAGHRLRSAINDLQKMAGRG